MINLSEVVRIRKYPANEKIKWPPLYWLLLTRFSYYTQMEFDTESYGALALNEIFV